MIAAAMLILALTTLAQLLSAGAVATRRARVMTLAAVLAQEKIESLVPPASIGAAGIDASPPGTLASNIDGYCDFTDAAGNVVGRGAMAPAASVYVRRWSIEPTSGSGPAFVLHVFVTDARRASGNDLASLALLPGDARLVSLVRVAS
jgi:hypothetical protein